MPTEPASPAPSTPPVAHGRPRRPWLAIGAVSVLGASLGVAGFTFEYAEGLSYLSDDPNACVNCHVMQDYFDAWQHASHHEHATCNACHVPHDSILSKYMVKAEHGWRHSKGFTLNNFHEPIQITPSSKAVVADNCMRCHSSIADDLQAHAQAFGTLDQASAQSQAADCLHCHTRVGHGPTR